MIRVRSYENKRILDHKLLFTASLYLTVALGIALRFYDLGAESYWRDEVIMAQVAGGSLEPLLMEVARGGGRPPVYVVLAHFWMQLFGNSEIATRSLSAVIGSISLILMYVVGRELFGRRVGLLSTFLMAISERQIYFSQDFRYYSLFVLMTLLSFLFCIRALKSGRWVYFVLYVASSILLFYTHYFAVFALVAQNLYFVLQWNRYRNKTIPWFLCQLLLLLPIAPRFLRLSSNQVAAAQSTEGSVGAVMWIPDPPLRAPFITIAQFIFSDYPSLVTYAVGLAFLIGAILFFIFWKGKGQWLAAVRDVVTSQVPRCVTSRRSELLLVSCWLLCPIVIPFVLSKVVAPMYVTRYNSSASPALYLLLALVIANIRKIVPEIISLGLLIILIAPGLHMYYVRDVKEQWREAAVYVEENATEGDSLIIPGSEIGSNAFHWYFRGSLPECSMEVTLRDEVVIADKLADCMLTTHSRRFWLILRGDLENSENIRHLRAFFLNRNNDDMRLIKEKELTYIFVGLFEWKKQ